MGEPDLKTSDHPQRDLTDESLRVERDKADTGIAEKREIVEAEADEVMRLARERADRIVQIARDDADHERSPQSAAHEASAERERAVADVILEGERSQADAVLDNERTERTRYLADFLAIERDATDADLVGEREHTDTVIAARDDFLATVSHDLRTLLCSLSLNAELVIVQAPAGEHGDRTRSHGATSQRLVSKMNRLVNDLLDVASIEAGKLAVVLEQVDTTQILHDTLEAFEPIAAAKRITLDTEAPTGPLLAALDGGRILQVLANLVSNAIKFTPAGGRVSIRIRAADGEIQFAVTDTGIGIPADALASVFERFKQVRQDRRGLGLGLHISKNIVEAHGGRMWAESTLAAGSTFHFVVPAAPASA